MFQKTEKRSLASTQRKWEKIHKSKTYNEIHDEIHKLIFCHSFFKCHYINSNTKWKIQF